jgi:CTP synthase (UTP-ammonia lyase)
MELEESRFFIGTQAHPGYRSRPLAPSPLFIGLIKSILSYINRKASVGRPLVSKHNSSGI